MSSRLSSVSRRRRSSESERARWRRKFFESGLTRKEFARRHGLNLWTLHNWLKGPSPTSPAAAEKDQQAPPFAQFTLPLSGSAWSAELVRGDGAMLRLSAQAPRELVRELLRAW